jgi:GTP-dependent phosphoenolpyruvate carboxykinase
MIQSVMTSEALSQPFGISTDEIKQQRVDRDAWRTEIIGHEELFLTLHDHLPKELIYERELLICRI